MTVSDAMTKEMEELLVSGSFSLTTDYGVPHRAGATGREEALLAVKALGLEPDNCTRINAGNDQQVQSMQDFLRGKGIQSFACPFHEPHKPDDDIWHGLVIDVTQPDYAKNMVAALSEPRAGKIAQETQASRERVLAYTASYPPEQRAAAVKTEIEGLLALAREQKLPGFTGSRGPKSIAM